MNKILREIMNLGNLSCLTNILENLKMGPINYDIICPTEGKTEVYINATKLTKIDDDSLFIENSLKSLLDYIEKKLNSNELLYIPFDNPNRRKYSDFKTQLKLSKLTQQRYERLAHGWIVIT